MMLLIFSRYSQENCFELAERTNKSFVWKQLLELLQLICSAGISKEFKPIKQGKEIQQWILKHKAWIYRYTMYLYDFCIHNINISPETNQRIKTIISDLHNSTDIFNLDVPKTAIFRYKQGYECNYANNSELPIEIAEEEYKKYIEWKFAEKETK